MSAAMTGKQAEKEERQALEIADALGLPEPDSITKLRNRAVFMASPAFGIEDHGWMAAALTKLAEEMDEEFLLENAESQSLINEIHVLSERKAELEVIRDLAIEAWSKLGDGGYFPSMGAPLSDSMRNALAKHSSAIKPIDRRAIVLDDGEQS